MLFLDFKALCNVAATDHGSWSKQAEGLILRECKISALGIKLEFISPLSIPTYYL